MTAMKLSEEIESLREFLVSLQQQSDQAKATPILFSQLIKHLIQTLKKLELTDGESKFRALFDSEVIPFMTWHRDGRILDANDAFLRLAGFTHDELKRGELRCDSLTPPEWNQRDSLIQSEIETKKKFGPFEKEYVRRDGSRVPVLIGGSALTSEGDVVISFVLDLSEQKRTQQKLREQAVLLNSAHDAIMVLDMQDRVLFWNSGAERLYGWSAEEAYGNDCRAMQFKNDPAKLDEIKLAMIEQGKWTGELRQVTKQGREIIVQSSRTLMYGEDGQPQSILSINTDITEQKNLEAQFLRTQRMESIGTLAGGIAHDFINILSPILLSIRVLRDRFTDEESRRSLELLQESAERGAALVRHILQFAKGTVGEFISFQPQHLLKEIVKMLKETLPKKIEIGCRIARDLWAITGDPTQIHQIVMNICLNASDAMPFGGKLVIKAENVYLNEKGERVEVGAAADRYVAISISDTGVGIPEQIRDKIFEPFFTTKPQGKGTGLGLSTVLRIVKAHKGFLDVQSDVGKGTRLDVYLPAAASSEARSIIESRNKIKFGKGESLLVVDDEAAIREVTRSTLELYGYRVLTARNGNEAVRLYAAKKNKIAAVLLDLMMPHMDGVVTIHRLREINPHVKIVVSTGMKAALDSLQVNGERLSGFIEKPYRAEELLQLLSKVLNRRSKRQGLNFR
ncbi:MAG TPA: PAS domain S-box protein [Blastocatellia bacterium]|nr:PAS domain S-box protein [Blastocatellia bacterium]